MAQTPYASLLQFKSVLDKVSESDDAVLDLALTGATRLINEQTGRRFDQQMFTRTFDSNGGRRLLVRDLVSVSSLAFRWFVNDTPRVVAVTDYFLGPPNTDDGWPYQWIDLARTWASEYDIAGGGTQWFPIGTQTVIVTGVWGWPAVPDDIVQVCLSIAARYWKAAKAGFNDVIGVDATGTVQFSKALSTLDRAVLARYRRNFIA